MSVSTTMPLVRNTPLVRLSDLDPERLLIWSGIVTADGSGGTLQGACEVPSGFAAGFASIDASISGGSTSNVFFVLNEDGRNIANHGAETFVINAVARSPSWRPPAILLVGDAIVITAFADNVSGDPMTVTCTAWAWSQATARNLPQKFFWPATVG